MKLLDLYKLERDTQVVLACMEFIGIRCDKVQLDSLGKELTVRIKDIKKQMYDIIGFEFNPASTKDLSHVIFNVLNLPKIRKTKTGYSTDDKTLDKLKGKHEIIALVKQFRYYSKTLSTYVKGLVEYIEYDGKVHTTYHQTVATGRLSSTNPNLQNLPTDSDLGALIKKAFIPDNKDKVFISFDYSQIDLRVLAYESKDENLMTAFKKGEDIHLSTAKIIFEKEDISKKERNFAKTINFGIVYGMEKYGLSQALEISNDLAQDFIDKYFKKYPGVLEYFKNIEKNLEEYHYVETFMGRKRYFPLWDSANHFQKKAILREAINMPIQGGSAEINKMALVKIFDYINTRNLDCDILLQIHDEIIIEIDKGEDLEKITEDVKRLMGEVYNLGIPLVVNSKKGNNLNFYN